MPEAGVAPKRRVVAIINAGGNGRWLPERLVALGVDCVHVRTPESRGAIGDSVHFLECDAPPFVAGYEVGPGGLETIVPRLRELGVDMVIAGSEGGVDIATVLANELGVVGSGPSIPGLCRDKGAMTRAVAEAGLATLPFRLCRAPEEVRAFWHEELRCQPVVVKLLRNSSGAGVLFCDDWRSIEAAVSSLVGSTDLYGGESEAVMVQKRAVSGDRIWEVCTVSAGGEHRIAMVIESRKDGAAYECMRVVHADEEALGPLIHYAEQVLDALTVRHGAAFIEIAVEEDRGPVLIECNARLIGALSPEFCRAVLGEAQVDLLARACADPERFIAEPAGSGGASRHGRLVHLRCDVDGVVRDGLAELRRGIESLPTLFKYRVAPEVGTSISTTVDLRTTPGSVQLVGESADEVAADHRRIRALEADGVYARAVGLAAPVAPEAREDRRSAPLSEVKR